MMKQRIPLFTFAPPVCGDGTRESQALVAGAGRNGASANQPSTQPPTGTHLDFPVEGDLDMRAVLVDAFEADEILELPDDALIPLDNAPSCQGGDQP